jgi:transposase
MKDTQFVGLDVHKDTISVAVAKMDRGDAESLGTISNTPQAVAKLLRKLGPAENLHFCYEAGPCGYSLYRQLVKTGARCDVVAPSLIPQRAGERVKTDRRDAQKLARLLRSGELTPVWVPDETQEALRDLSRAREDAQEDLVRKRHQLTKFLLRLDLRPPEGVKVWTKAHRQWMERLQFTQPVHRVVLSEYLHALDEVTARVERLEKELEEQAKESSQAPVIQALQSLRGVGVVTAVTVVAELGDLTRFPSAKQAMDYVGLVPSEHSSGGKRRQGSITKSGNAHARFVLVEAAWHYRHPPRIGDKLRQRQESQPEVVKAIAWKAQHRLHLKYRRLMGRGKTKQVAAVAVARELLGFMWAIAREVANRQAVKNVA